MLSQSESRSFSLDRTAFTDYLSTVRERKSCVINYSMALAAQCLSQPEGHTMNILHRDAQMKMGEGRGVVCLFISVQHSVSHSYRYLFIELFLFIYSASTCSKHKPSLTPMGDPIAAEKTAASQHFPLQSKSVSKSDQRQVQALFNLCLSVSSFF